MGDDEARRRSGGVTPGTPVTPDDCKLYAEWLAPIHDWLDLQIKDDLLDEDGELMLDPIPVEQATEWCERLREVALRLRSAGGPPA